MADHIYIYGHFPSELMFVKWQINDSILFKNTSPRKMVTGRKIASTAECCRDIIQPRQCTNIPLSSHHNGANKKIRIIGGGEVTEETKDWKK